MSLAAERSLRSFAVMRHAYASNRESMSKETLSRELSFRINISTLESMLRARVTGIRA